MVILQLAAARWAMDWCLLRLSRQPRRLMGHTDGRWTLLLNDDTQIDAGWRPGFLAIAGMVAGSVRGEGQCVHVLAIPGNSTAESRRRLAARLRWTPGEQLWNEC